MESLNLTVERKIVTEGDRSSDAMRWDTEKRQLMGMGGTRGY